MKAKVIAALLLLIAAITISADEKKSAIAPNASFDKMKTLQGSWAGTMAEGGKEYPVTTRFALISDGSALMAWLGEGTPQEMVTIFHMDGKDLLGTHYCGAHNQPRFIAEPGGDPNRIVFKFKDGTNIASGDGHMQEVAFIFDGPDHHVEEWTYNDGTGKLMTGKFDFKRKK